MVLPPLRSPYFLPHPPDMAPAGFPWNNSSKASLLDNIYMNPLPLTLNQIESEHFKVTEFEGVCV